MHSSRMDRRGSGHRRRGDPIGTADRHPQDAGDDRSGGGCGSLGQRPPRPGPVPERGTWARVGDDRRVPPSERRSRCSAGRARHHPSQRPGPIDIVVPLGHDCPSCRHGSASTTPFDRGIVHAPPDVTGLDQDRCGHPGCASSCIGRLMPYRCGPPVSAGSTTWRRWWQEQARAATDDQRMPGARTAEQTELTPVRR